MQQNSRDRTFVLREYHRLRLGAAKAVQYFAEAKDFMFKVSGLSAVCNQVHERECVGAASCTIGPRTAECDA